MFRVGLIVTLEVLAGCDGTLREKPGQSDVDASVLTTIPPPMCDLPMIPTDTGDCLGGGQPGDDCLQCHHQGGLARAFTFAGTLYDAMDQPLGGATLYLQDSVGNVATAVAHPTNGNFYSADGFVMFPAKAFVSLCPDVVEMVSPVDEVTGANCNTSGCHTAGFRVRIP